jgi:hypothetical protein
VRRWLRPVWALGCLFLLIVACGVPSGPLSDLTLGQSNTLSEGQAGWIIVQLKSVEIVGSPKDADGVNEFQLFVFLIDPKGNSAHLVYPGPEPAPMRQGGVADLGEFALGADAGALGEGDLTVWFLGVDSDELPGVGISSDQAGDLLAEGVGALMGTQGIPEGPVVSEVVDSGSQLAGWLDQHDVIGDQAITLRHEDGYRVGNTDTITTQDGGLEIAYEVYQAESALAPVQEGMFALASETVVTATTTPGQQGCGDRVVSGDEQCESDKDCGFGESCQACQCVVAAGCGDGTVSGEEQCESDDQCGGRRTCQDCQCVKLPPDGSCGNGECDRGEGDGVCDCDCMVCGDGVCDAPCERGWCVDCTGSGD